MVGIIARLYGETPSLFSDIGGNLFAMLKMLDQLCSVATDFDLFFFLY